MSTVISSNRTEWFGKLSDDAELSRVGINYMIILGKMLTSEPKDDQYSLENYYCAANVHFDRIISEDLKQMWFSQKEKEQYLVNTGDLLIVEGGAGAGGCSVVTKVDDPIYIQNSIMIVRGKNGNSTVFLKYVIEYLVKGGYVDVVCNKATIPHFTKDKLSQTPFPLFSVIKQYRIAEFLDRKCAEIDSVISKTKATIEQYKSLKQSVITQAVTKGIRTDRPMKDSGIEWIGEIPQEWSKDKVFRSFSIIGSGTTPKSSDDSNYEGNINWIQSGDINGEVLLSVKKHLSYEAVKEYSALRLYSSPFIVIAMYGASIGNLSISEIDSCVNQACCVLAEPKIRIKYAFYSIKAAKDYLITKAVGGGQPNISQDIVKSLWLPIPPVQEQQEISDYLDSKCAEIDRLIAAKEQLLTELESYKKSVIYEYVTGKKEV